MENQQMKPLAVVPIFRANTLYRSMFPDVKPLFKQNEEPSAKKLYDFLAKQGGKRVIMDSACFFVGYKEPENFHVADIPEVLGFTKVPMSKYSKNLVDVWSIYHAFAEKMNVTFERHQHFSDQFTLIDNIICSHTHENFTKETIKMLLGFAKGKNRLLESIRHVTIISTRLNYGILVPVGDEEGKTKALSLLKNGIMEEFNNVQSVTISPTIACKDIGRNDFVIVDQDYIIREENQALLKKFEQLLVLPLFNELKYSEQYLGDKYITQDAANNFRKLFEVE